MGSSSKKHKSEKKDSSRKRKHRSRSRSPTERRPDNSESSRNSDKHRRKHREKQKRDNRDKGPEYSNRPGSAESESSSGVDAPPPPKIGRPSTPPAPAISASGDSSLSIDETNKLRIKLGLKPLQTSSNESTSKSNKSSSELMGGKDMGEFVHRPAESLTHKKKSEKIRDKLAERRARRDIENKLKATKGIADEDSDDDAAAWVNKTRKIQQEKELAKKREKLLEEMDAEFGVGDLVHDDVRHENRTAYTAKDLRGLTVEHSLQNIAEEKTVILTLKDKDVLDEEDDVLVNVNIQDEERYRKNNERKKLKPHLHGYNAYDEEEVDEYGNVKKNLLGKYDEETGASSKDKFVIGRESLEEQRKIQAMKIKEKLMRKTKESLELPAMQLASEYFTPEEMTQFKKPKKKIRKIRKKVLKASDLLTTAPSDTSEKDLAKRTREEKSRGFRPVGEQEAETSTDINNEPEDMEVEFHLDIDDLPPPPHDEDLYGIKLEPDEGELELQLALNKARKLKQKENARSLPSIDRIAESVRKIKKEEDDDTHGNITLNETAEFCRTLGDIPTYGLAGNRDEDAEELMDFEREMNEEKRREAEEKQQRGAWAEVEVIEERPVEIIPQEAPILDEEPDVGTGVAGALQLALSKGYLEKETSNRPSASRMHHLQAQNYSIDDKNHMEEEKFGRRERYSGPISDFKEKDSYKPNVKLEYIDDDGRQLNAKEAFRYLSHKFHGKGPGKNKIEKRLKKVEQEVLMKKMSSTDTPLGTLNMLQQKQKETHSPYVVLSGSKQLSSISKTKM